jgi:hypothetical protein
MSGVENCKGDFDGWVDYITFVVARLLEVSFCLVVRT